MRRVRKRGHVFGLDKRRQHLPITKETGQFVFVWDGSKFEPKMKNVSFSDPYKGELRCRAAWQ